MATLPLLESGRVQVNQVGQAQLPMVNVPQVDPIGQRVQAQASGMIAQALDRMSNNLFGESARYMERAGQQYVIDNPPTPDQLQAAMRGEPTDLKAGGGFNVFDLAVRKARSIELSTYFEAEQRNVAVRVLNEVEAGKLTAEDARMKLATATDGLDKALSKTADPDAVLRFRATSATVGNQVLKAALESDLKRAKEQRKALLDADSDNIIRLLERTVKDGYWTDSQGNQRSVDELAGVYREKILQSSIVLGDAGLQKEYSTRFDDALKKAKVGAVSEYVITDDFAADPLQAIKRLDKGDAGKMSAIWNDPTITFDDKAKIRANLRSIALERQGAKDQAEKDQLQADTLEVAKFTDQYMRTGSRSALDALRAISIRNPKAITPEHVFKLPQARQEGELANPRAEFVLKTEIMNGQHADPVSIEKRARELGISYKRLNDGVLNFYISRTNEDERDIERLFRTESKIVPGQLNISQKQNAAYSQLTTRFEKTYAEQVSAAQAAGKPTPTRMAVARQIITDRQTSEQSKRISDLLSQLNINYGSTGNIRKTGIVFTEESDYQEIAKRQKDLGLLTEDLEAIRQKLQIIEEQRKALDAR